jgi:hypothetical protein
MHRWDIIRVPDLLRPEVLMLEMTFDELYL